MENIIRISLSLTSCYLIKGNQGYLMVDCGSSGDEKELLTKLHKAKISLASIRWLFLTHHHSDHCGLLPFMVSQNPDMKIIMSRKCAQYLGTGNHFQPASEQFATKALGYAFGLYRRAGGTLHDTFPAYRSREEDVIFSAKSLPVPDFVGIKGQLIHTPGHTEDSFSLIVGEDAFVGDAARNILGFLGARYQPILFYDRATCLKSWSDLLSRGVRRVHPGHGNSFEVRLLINALKDHSNSTS